MSGVQVRKVRRTTSRPNRTTSKKNWQVRQPTAAGKAVRVFVYSEWWQAIENANRLSRSMPICTFGLRGFHIEYG
ncbi:hypothetical protein [Mycobacterium avium]|uniref:hypothetical protein n=1 Tax=Mycobacterium avium TaxID=1764 RepID=UPI000CE48FC0|nr:hypothetical protein [Mycobacterium avium]